MAFKITNKGLYWGLIATFGLLYVLVALVSTLHAVDFFKLSNIGSLAILLGVAYEVGQASVLFSILMTKNKEKFLPWLLMFLLTALQVTANVYASFKHMSIDGGNDWTYWYTSILKIFGVTGGSTETYQVIISWISGALLPIVALGMTALVATNIKLITEEDELENNPNAPIPASDLIAEVSKVNPTEDDLKEAEAILSKKSPERYTEKRGELAEEEIERIRNLMDTDPIKNGAISDNMKKVLSPGLPLEDDAGNSPREQISKILNDNISVEVKTNSDETVPALSEEEVREAFMDELEGDEPNEDPSDDVEAQTPPENEPEPIPVEPEVLPPPEPSPPEPSPPPQYHMELHTDVEPPPSDQVAERSPEQLEADRLERLREIARENLKKKLPNP